ncbi:MAG: hypothetical protein AAGN64_01105 [Bacteroidota bacterium]
MQARLSLFLLVLLVAGWTLPAVAQSIDRVFVQIDYVAVPEGGETDYLAVEREIWKPIHQERVRAGLIEDWVVLEARLATTTSAYNYLTLTIFEDFAQLESAIPGSIVAKAHPDADTEVMMDRTLDSRDILHTEVWELVATVGEGGANRPEAARYEVLNFMMAPPTATAEYEATEQDVWGPIHQARIDNETLSGWAVYRLVLPAGTAVNYNYLTIDYYTDLGDYAEPVDEPLMRRAHNASAAEIETMMARTEASRVIYKSELWNVVESVGDVRVTSAASPGGE